MESPSAWAEEITTEGVRTLADSLAAEVLPLADACRFLERNAASVLKERKAPQRDRPLWGRGLAVRVRREPWGAVLVIGAGNYPLFLAGVQILQAITAGNAVLVKPAPRASAPMRRLVQVLQESGMQPGLVQVLPEAPAAAEEAMQLGVGKVVLTGSATTGRKVMAKAAQTLTPCTMELSGCDAVLVLAGADLARVVAALTFGLRLNGGATCIGPRRVFVTHEQADDLIARLRNALPSIPATRVAAGVARQAQDLVSEALSCGATLVSASPVGFDPDAFAPIVLDAPTTDLALFKADLFAPVLSIVRVANDEQALELSNRCPYALGASVFGDSHRAARLANRIQAGCVTINDLVAPTADPRVPFGGWNQSGFGVTRGAEGLLEMTRAKTVILQRSGWLPHLDPPLSDLDRLLAGLLRAAHGKSWIDRWRGLREVIRASGNRNKE